MNTLYLMPRSLRRLLDLILHISRSAVGVPLKPSASPTPSAAAAALICDKNSKFVSQIQFGSFADKTRQKIFSILGEKKILNVKDLAMGKHL